jgi:hypothetical protein
VPRDSRHGGRLATARSIPQLLCLATKLIEINPIRKLRNRTRHGISLQAPAARDSGKEEAKAKINVTEADTVLPAGPAAPSSAPTIVSCRRRREQPRRRPRSRIDAAAGLASVLVRPVNAAPRQVPAVRSPCSRPRRPTWFDNPTASGCGD